MSEPINRKITCLTKFNPDKTVCSLSVTLNKLSELKSNFYREIVSHLISKYGQETFDYIKLKNKVNIHENYHMVAVQIMIGSYKSRVATVNAEFFDPLMGRLLQIVQLRLNALSCS